MVARLLTPVVEWVSKNIFASIPDVFSRGRLLLRIVSHSFSHIILFLSFLFSRSETGRFHLAPRAGLLLAGGGGEAAPAAPSAEEEVVVVVARPGDAAFAAGGVQLYCSQ